MIAEYVLIGILTMDLWGAQLNHQEIVLIGNHQDLETCNLVAHLYNERNYSYTFQCYKKVELSE